MLGLAFAVEHAQGVAHRGAGQVHAQGVAVGGEREVSAVRQARHGHEGGLRVQADGGAKSLHMDIWLASLLALNARWGCGLDRARLMDLGLRLGADVPFFVFGRNAWGEGVGERLQALELPPAWYLVLVPQVAVSTKEIFTDPALTRDSKPLKIPPFLSGQGRNDLQAVAVRRYPEIADHLAWLEQQGLQARMTGSGACVFAAFPDRESAAAVHARLPPAMQGFVARGLQRHPLHDWA